MSDTADPTSAASEQVEPATGSVFVACPTCGYVTTVPASRLGQGRDADPYCEHTEGPPLWQGKHGRYATRMLRVTVHVIP